MNVLNCQRNLHPYTIQQCRNTIRSSHRRQPRGVDFSNLRMYALTENQMDWETLLRGAKMWQAAEKLIYRITVTVEHKQLIMKTH